MTRPFRKELVLLVLDDVLTSSYTLRIEVWESDYEYDENQNDYLGDIEFTRDSIVNSSML